MKLGIHSRNECTADHIERMRTTNTVAVDGNASLLCGGIQGV